MIDQPLCCCIKTGRVKQIRWENSTNLVGQMHPIVMSQLIKHLIKNTPCGLVAWHTEHRRRPWFVRIKGAHANATLIWRLIRNTGRMCDMMHAHTQTKILRLIPSGLEMYASLADSQYFVFRPCITMENSHLWHTALKKWWQLWIIEYVSFLMLSFTQVLMTCDTLRQYITCT